MDSLDSKPNLIPLRSEEGPSDFSPGMQLGKYELIRRLSVGGMAEIFLARAVGLPGFHKLVAIKRILPQLAANAEFVEMFLDEARIAATLQHSQIVQTYDVCIISGSYIIAMEYLHGEDLRALLSASVRAGKRLPFEHVLQIMIALLGGLHYAHEKEDFEGRPLEIVHRDVTPGNVFLTYEGGVKLLDFGIAKAASHARDRNTGSVKGKVSYMSPEQARGESVDRRTDVFAAGVILYELSLGRKLYRGTDYEILTNIVKGRFDRPSQVDSSYDAPLEKIVLRALARDRDDRYATALEMQVELEGLAKSRGMYLSPTGLKQLMEELFREKLEAWRQAQKQGKSLDEHLEIDASYEDEGSAELPQPPRRRRTVAMAVGASAVVVALAAGALVVRGRPAPAPAKAHVTAPRAAAIAPAPAEPSPVPDAPRPAATGHASLKVLTHPHGASLLLDGKPVGRSPFVIETLAEGEHTIVAQLRDHLEVVRKITVAADQHPTLTLLMTKAGGTAVHAAPPPETVHAAKLTGDGTLAIASNPWCTVSVDGVERGQTPLNLALPAGKHTVLLANPDYKIRRQLSVNIAPGESVKKKLDFTE